MHCSGANRRGSIGVSRRNFLAGVGLAYCGAGRLSRLVTAADSEKSLREALGQAGIAAPTIRETASYLAAGDAPAEFLQQALALCEALAQDFLKHFQSNGFGVVSPPEKLTLIVLSGPRSYAAWTGTPAEEAVGGHYDLATNRLVIFDNRNRDEAGPEAARANTVALMHEAVHQLCFNSGLLDRLGDVPKLVSEGLATYGEVRRPGGRTRVGDPNTGRLAVLRSGEWLPLERLWTDDALFDAPETQQQAYAQGWLAMQTLVSREAWRGRFRSYLDRIRPRRDAASRKADILATLGEIPEIEAALREPISRARR